MADRGFILTTGSWPAPGQHAHARVPTWGELLAAGAWQQAHEIVQREEPALAAWLHGIVHTLEGDLDNARYWYRKANRTFADPDAVQQEIAEARRMVQGGA